MNVLFRWIKFNAVGGLGVAIQLATLGFLLHCFDFHYIPATAIAVEAAILHNYVWHEKWTWSDIAFNSSFPWTQRLLRFHLTNGFTSLVGNLMVMRSLVGTFHVPALYANLIAIAACSLVNFLLSHHWVFRVPRFQRTKESFQSSVTKKEAWDQTVQTPTFHSKFGNL